MANENNQETTTFILRGDFNSTSHVTISATVNTTETLDKTNTVVYVLITVVAIIFIVLISIGIIFLGWFCHRKSIKKSRRQSKYVHNNLSTNTITSSKKINSRKVQNKHDIVKLQNAKDAWPEKMDRLNDEQNDTASMTSYRSDLETIIEEASKSSKSVSASSSFSEMNENSLHRTKKSNITLNVERLARDYFENKNNMKYKSNMDKDKK